MKIFNNQKFDFYNAYIRVAIRLQGRTQNHKKTKNLVTAREMLGVYLWRVSDAYIEGITNHSPLQWTISR